MSQADDSRGCAQGFLFCGSLLRGESGHRKVHHQRKVIARHQRATPSRGEISTREATRKKSWAAHKVELTQNTSSRRASPFPPNGSFMPPRGPGNGQFPPPSGFDSHRKVHTSGEHGRLGGTSESRKQNRPILKPRGEGGRASKCESSRTASSCLHEPGPEWGTGFMYFRRARQNELRV